MQVSHIADAYRRYPGETVVFSTRFDVLFPASGLEVRVSIPGGMELGAYRAPGYHRDTVPTIETRSNTTYLIWDFQEDLRPGTGYEYQVEATVAPVDQDVLRDNGMVLDQLTLESRAEVVVWTSDEKLTRGTDAVTIVVPIKGRYLQYLPLIYEDDDFMGRFLMLFESFWAPIESQIDQMEFYFDPQLAPVEFLPWLASWLDLVLDERWPEDRRRLLLQSSASLYRKRGTAQGLKEHLEIYTGGDVQIIEHRARNFSLGPKAYLGPGIALGRDNIPHTFTVVLRLLPISPSVGKEEAARMEMERRRTIEAIIEVEKPAFAGYTLHIEAEAIEGL